eukprot:gene259-750_t
MRTFIWPLLLQPAFAYHKCEGTDVMPADYWDHLKPFSETWVDLTLGHSRLASNFFRRVESHGDGALEEAVEDCGMGVLTSILAGLRYIDYSNGADIALDVFYYARYLIERMAGHFEEAFTKGWEFDLKDFDSMEQLINTEKNQHDCYGSDVKIFVYDFSEIKPEWTRGTLDCHYGQWGLEVWIPHWIKTGSCLTEKPEEADFFLVPWYTWCDMIIHKDNQSEIEIEQEYQNLMNTREELLPYFAKHKGRDHIFIFSDPGMNFFPSWKHFIPDSIFIVTESHTPECGKSCFQPWKDMILPGHTDYFRYRRMASFNLPTEQLDLIFSFHGRHPTVHEFYRNNTVRGAIIDLFSELPGVSVGGFVSDYFDRMGASHFCLIPIGTSSWTNHLYESFFAGCIPVILSDNYGVPFTDLIDWSQFSIKWPMHKVSIELYDYLRSRPISVIKQMKERVDNIACMFDYHRTYEKPNQHCSPYKGMISTLERRKKAFEPRLPDFWAPMAELADFPFVPVDPQS